MVFNPGDLPDDGSILPNAIGTPAGDGIRQSLKDGLDFMNESFAAATTIVKTGTQNMVEVKACTEAKNEVAQS